MQVHFIVKTCFFFFFLNYIYINPVVELKLMNYFFYLYDIKIYFMKCVWRSNSQNYNFPF